MVGIITNVQIFREPNPENLEGQKPQNLAQFRTTFEFNRKCLRNQLKYQKAK